MQILQAVFLGIVQGLTEFIPVSSSGHLVLMDQLFNFSVSGFVFDAILNIGTLSALVIYFRKDFWQFFKSIWVGGADRKTLGLIILATIPGVVAGVLLQDLAETKLRSSYVVILMLVLVGLAMLVVEKYGKRLRGIKDLTAVDSIIVGAAQILAFLPGTSRSGITITAGAARGLTREAAAKFSFYLALPILGGGVLKVMFDDGVLSQVQDNMSIFIAGILAAFVSGYFAIAFLLKYLQKHGLQIFAYYRFILAATILLIVLF